MMTMGTALAWAGMIATVVLLYAGVILLDRWTRPLGQRWAARIDAWFDRKLGDGR